MSIASRFRHDIVIHRWTAGGATDSRGHRDDTWVPVVPPVRGWIQPRASREIQAAETAGVAVSDHLAFVDIRAVITAKDILQESEHLYDVIGQPRDAAARGKHLEISLREVTP